MESRRLHVKAATLYVCAENGRRERLSARVTPKGILDGDDAVLNREEPLDVPPAEDQRRRGWRIRIAKSRAQHSDMVLSQLNHRNLS
jgi:hypothetical protein